jgi:glyceraldehyde 3-phosphate dehydrogenase
MVPSSTGAAKAIGEVLPNLQGKLDGIAVRVPTPNVSLVDLVVIVKNKATRDDVNKALKAAAEGPMKGVLGFSEEPLVSSDYMGCPLSSVVDGLETKVKDSMVKVFAWYDNEWGYSKRLQDLINLVGSKL